MYICKKKKGDIFKVKLLLVYLARAFKVTVDLVIVRFHCFHDTVTVYLVIVRVYAFCYTGVSGSHWRVVPA